MHLRRLDIHGFKAFADRQRFEFGPGMTVVAGPNGSGKSNIADAIRWALGEQATRSIRARKTEDVIFSGSEQRRQMGSAEVTLTLDNSEGWMPVEYGEVSVTRRAFRSGDNEYLINGQRVRLADVLDLFRRAQVGQNSYAMMSQGLVDEVLALRPQERRELIEEAADVRRHRQQLTLSERRLTETRDNLGHVRMLIRELEPRLRQLERQSKKAERYRELDGQLREALSVYYEQELRRAQDALAAARGRHDQRTQAFQQSRAALERLDARLGELGSGAAERRRALEALQAQERQLAEEGLRLEQQIALAEQRLELLGQRRGEVEAELAAVDAEPQEAMEQAPGVELERRVEETRTALAMEREALQAADAAARTVLRDLAEAEARRARLEAEAADAERRIAEDERRQREHATQHEAARTRRQAALAQLRSLGVRFLERARRDTTLGTATGQARRQREQAEARLEERLRALIEARDAVRVAEARVRQQQEREAMLGQLLGQTAPGGAGTQALLAAARDETDAGTQAGGDAAQRLEGVVGAIAELIRVPEGLQLAVEAALADRLGAVVVERERDAIEAIAYLREQAAGMATLLPLDGTEHNYPLNLFNERGVVGVAARLVRVDQRYRPLVDTLLGRTIVVEDLEVARRMVRRGLGAVVTRDGVLLRPDGSYYGGAGGAGAQHFALRAELEALPEQIARAQATVEVARGRLQQAEDVITAERGAVESARTAVDAAEDVRRAHQQQLGLLRQEQAALAAEMRPLHALLARVPEGSTAEAARQGWADARTALTAVAREIETLRDRSEAVGAERDAAAERVAAATGALATAEGAQRVELERRQERTEARRRRVERLEQLHRQAAEARREAEDLELALRGHREQAANNRSARALAQATIGPAHAALAEASAEERELAATRGDLHNRLLAAERGALQAESELRECASRLQQLQQQLADEGLVLAADGSVRAAPADGRAVQEDSGEAQPDAAEHSPAVPAPLRGGAAVDPAELRARISELRGEIRALGPVNVEAIEDLGEDRERHAFLSGQVEDLESAERELRAAIAELRVLVRTRFDETFKRVDVAFGDYFQRFFGGGTASLSLIEPADDAPGDDPGVEITAQPPGKRIASLHVLSGGERALTSVALLFALLSVNPAPVCVLDEVDAALDEANVGRFVDTLRELCGRSQFIVVSHNRRTIEAADAIYGISMGEDSTSRVLSLRLADLPQAS